MILVVNDNDDGGAVIMVLMKMMMVVVVDDVSLSSVQTSTSWMSRQTTWTWRPLRLWVKLSPSSK